MARDEPALIAIAKPPQGWDAARQVALTVAIGSVGGAVFSFLTLPLPWMLGPMAVVMVGTLAGWRLYVPRWFRSAMITVLGIMLGSAFTPEVVARMGEWIVTLSALMIWMALVGTIALAYLRRVAGYDPITAFFSATPGGLAEMMLVGGQMGGDERTIALTHATRIVIVVFAIPFWFRFGGLLAPDAARDAVGLLDLALLDVIVLGLCAPLGYLGARALRIPAAALLGPMVLSAAVHLGGLTASKPPDVVLAVAQIVIGGALGCRFAGATLARIARTALHAAVTAAIMLSATIAFALVLARMTGFAFSGIVLAFAPGGLAEMSLVALALAIDTAFVASHHIVRIGLVVTLAPLAFRLFRRWS
jgi:uncharacterized protein